MNFLAHSYLSGSDPEVVVGNFIGDFVKGKQYLDYPDSIQNGIRLHREIDTFMDTHSIPQESRNRLKAKYRHYSGVIVDMYYDHLLAKNWSKYHEQDLLTFTEEVYSHLQELDDLLPKAVKRMLSHMIPGNWMYHYRHLEGIHSALSGMARRTKFESKMEEATEDLEAHYEDFEAEFSSFFPEVKAFAESYEFVVR